MSIELILILLVLPESIFFLLLLQEILVLAFVMMVERVNIVRYYEGI